MVAERARNAEIDLLDGRFYGRDPQRELAWMRRNAPVYWDEPRGIWGVALHEDVQRVSKDAERFCSSGRRCHMYDSVS